MTSPRGTRTDAVDLAVYGHILRRGWLPMALCSLAGALVGCALTVQTPPLYTSKSTVLVADAPLYLTTQGQVASKRFTIDTEAERLVSAPVLSATQTATGDADVLAQVDIAAIPTTKVLVVTYTSTRWQTAERGANAMTANYLRVRRAELERSRDLRLELLGQQLTTLNARLDASATPDKATPAHLATQRATRNAISEQIAQQQAAVRQVRASSSYPGEVISAGVRTSPARLNPVVPPASGLALGALLGLLGALALRSRVGTAADVQRRHPSRSVMVLPRRISRRGTRKVWDPLLVRMLASEQGSIAVPSTGEAELATAHHLSAELRARGRDVPVVRAKPVPLSRTSSHLPCSTLVMSSSALVEEAGSELAAQAKSVVLVLTPRTRHSTLQAALRRASEVGASVRGIVLVPRFTAARVNAASSQHSRGM